MVGETTMNIRNASNAARPDGVAQDVVELTRDVVALAELQFELFRNDCRHGLKGLLIYVTLLLISAMVAVGTVPIALILIAELLVQAAGWSRAAAYGLATATGAGAAVALGVLGWSRIRGVGRVFERSRQEFAHNLTWIKNTLTRAAPSESQPSHDR
jgi:hypothetical protein